MNLTDKQREKLWGEDGPYSQANLIIQERILDDSLSRRFLVVEAEINPLTFEMIKQNREEFKDNEKVLQLLDHADNRGKFGYVVSSYENEFRGKQDMEEAQQALDYTRETIILMHRYVMRVLGNLEGL